MDRQPTYFEQDGIHVHYVRLVYILLEDFFDDKILATNGPMRISP